MKNAINLYLTETDRANVEAIRIALSKKGMKFTDPRGNASTSALIRYLLDEKVKELTIKVTP